MSADTPVETKQKVGRGDLAPGCPAHAGADAVWHVQDFAGARAVLRSTETRQAGFGVENADKLPPKMRCAETLVRKAGRTLGFPVIPVRKAMLHGRSAPGRSGRMPCHFCGHCMQGCEVGAIFTSTNTLLPLARATGNLTLRTNALVRRIETNAEGRATGVTFVDRATREDHTVSAKIVVVSCGAIESPRLLLNSATTRFPNGVANSSDLVGRYLTGHAIAQFHGYVKPLMGREARNEDGATDHAIIPRFRPINAGRGYLQSAPWIVFGPGVALFVTVVGLNFVGDAIRDALDPRLRG